MPAQKLLAPGQVRAARVVSGGVLGLLTFGTVLALVTYPSWQLGVALACLVVAIPAAFAAPGGMLAPFQQGVPARVYLRSAALPLAVVGLVVVAGVMFSSAPTS